MSPREILMANIENLPDQRKQWAYTMLGARPTEKVMAQIAKLADETLNPSRPIIGGQVKNVSSIINLLTRPKLAWPKINFKVGPRTLQLCKAGDKAKFPGSINVKDYYDGTWYGRIHLNGEWEISKAVGISSTSDEIFEALRIFGENPAKVAADYGHLTGHCCFCSLPLSDERSVFVGYGKTCAGHYNLPWGMK